MVSTDPWIAAHIHAALGDARTVVNVGAGAGSYEPGDRPVLAFEPSEVMRALRPEHLVPAIPARAEDLPLDSPSADAALAVLTVHHWEGPAADYLPEAIADDRRRFPAVPRIAELLGGARVESIPIPADCVDGFFEAYGRSARWKPTWPAAHGTRGTAASGARRTITACWSS